MTADLLRRAAALMRERAEQVEAGEWYDATDELVWALNENCGTLSAYADADHIASWGPAVALAVAEAMDSTARTIERGKLPLSRDIALIRAARAYLGESGPFRPERGAE